MVWNKHILLDSEICFMLFSHEWPERRTHTIHGKHIQRSMQIANGAVQFCKHVHCPKHTVGSILCGYRFLQFLLLRVCLYCNTWLMCSTVSVIKHFISCQLPPFFIASAKAWNSAFFPLSGQLQCLRFVSAWRSNQIHCAFRNHVFRFVSLATHSH
jgi:hypothetical protein